MVAVPLVSLIVIFLSASKALVNVTLCTNQSPSFWIALITLASLSLGVYDSSSGSFISLFGSLGLGTVGSLGSFEPVTSAMSETPSNMAPTPVTRVVSSISVITNSYHSLSSSSSSVNVFTIISKSSTPAGILIIPVVELYVTPFVNVGILS